MTLTRILVQIPVVLAAVIRRWEWRPSGQPRRSGTRRWSIILRLSRREAGASANRALGGLPKMLESNHQPGFPPILDEEMAL
jgi:hypothetical protein